MLIIGSVAMAQHMPFMRGRGGLKDIDAIIWPEDLESFIDGQEMEVVKSTQSKCVLKSQGGLHYEFELATQGSNQEMLLKQLGVSPGQVKVADLELLYALKMSHRHLRNSPHFLKTMRDIHIMREKLGTKEIAERYQTWYDIRVKDTYWYQHPKLNKSKSEFFDPSVFENGFVYEWDHDSIHQAVKLLDRPAYTYFTDAEVKSNKNLFYNHCSEEIRLASVYEESAVLALERAVLPSGTDPDVAFRIALEKVCTSIASGWWRDYAWEHYADVVKMYKERRGTTSDYVTKFQIGRMKGIVKPFKGAL